MRLVIGGAYQGKREFVLRQLGVPAERIADGAVLGAEAKLNEPGTGGRGSVQQSEEPGTVERSGAQQSGEPGTAVRSSAQLLEELGTAGLGAVEHYHLRVRAELEAGREPLRELEALLSAYPEIVLIADEIGMGILPIERAERDYREAVGRVLCAAAERATEVWRVVCGIGTRIR